MTLHKNVDLKIEKSPLILEELPQPVPNARDILIKVSACGVCHTELDEIEGRTLPSRFPIVLGHQIVGTVVETGGMVHRFKVGNRVGVAWIHSACQKCSFCLDGKENLCEHFEATGRDVNGGYAEYHLVDEDFAYPIPEGFTDSEAAPLLCAGAVGYRSLRLTGIKDGQILGFFGFGASAHLVIQIVKYHYPNSPIFVFARSEKEREFARQLGATWCGDIDDKPPELLHAAIDTTPVWKPILSALEYIESGGRLVINAIRKENADKESLQKLDYAVHLWKEKEIKSVANVTRRDVEEFLELASLIPIHPEIQEYELQEANLALIELKERKIRGAKVLRI